jgi:arylformamidase
MIAIDYEAEYNNRLRVTEYPAIVARWQSASSAVRQAPGAELDQPYGAGERQRYDLFHAAERTAPLVVFIHGGYWQLGDRQLFASLARALTTAGVAVAVPSYSLCPAVSVMQIVEELRCCLAALWTRTQQHPVVIGHSAGGHLTAAMLATDWRQVSGVPADLVRTACAISGVFELTPLIATSVNVALRLDPETAVAASPLRWPPPPPGRRFVAAVGGDETREFHRQSRTLVEAWGGAGVQTEYVPVAGTNHFTILDELANPASALFGRVVSLARP